MPFSELPLWLVTGIFFILGSVVGSFLNVVILRLPEDKSLHGRSACPHCHTQLRWYDLVPLISFLVLGGRCRTCRKPVSWRYFIIEFLTGLTFALLFMWLRPATAFDFVLFARAIFFSCFLVITFVVDLEHYLILDWVLLPAGIIILLLNIGLDLVSLPTVWWQGHTVSGLIGGGAVCLLFYGIWRLSRGQWMGFGDVKLVFVLGLMVGWPLIIVNLFLGFGIGALVSLVLLALGTKKMKSAIPFGTFLAVSAFITMVCGSNLWVWYLTLIGWR
jgi:leader peptidase (prepilin peptidase) / N-methyltransferase